MKEAHAKFNILYYTEKIYPSYQQKPIRKRIKGLKIRSSGAIAEFLKESGRRHQPDSGRGQPNLASRDRWT